MSLGWSSVYGNVSMRTFLQASIGAYQPRTVLHKCDRKTMKNQIGYDWLNAAEELRLISTGPELIEDEMKNALSLKILEDR